MVKTNSLPAIASIAFLALIETLKEIYGILFARWTVKNSIVVSQLQQGGCSMKKIALLTAALLALSSVAASAQTYVGKGKAPPPPVVTKG
jgi:hypothetical protein